MPSEETVPVFILVFLGQLSTQVVGGAGGGGLGSRIKVTWMLIRKLKVNLCNQCGCGSNLKVTLK